MTCSLNIEPGSLEAMEGAVKAAFEAVKQPVHEAMTGAVHTVVLNNFGSSGPLRPFDWQPLSEKYARKVGRTFATLYVTGALKDTVRKDVTAEAGVVSMSNTGMVPYAMAHHHGNPGNFGWTMPGSGELPARRVFPLDPMSDEVMPEVEKLVEQAARQAIKEAF